MPSHASGSLSEEVSSEELVSGGVTINLCGDWDRDRGPTRNLHAVPGSLSLGTLEGRALALGVPFGILDLVLGDFDL